MDIIFGGTNLHNVAAGTLNGRSGIIWMYVRFHFYFNPLHMLRVHGFQEILIIFRSLHFIK